MAEAADFPEEQDVEAEGQHEYQEVMQDASGTRIPTLRAQPQR